MNWSGGSGGQMRQIKQKYGRKYTPAKTTLMIINNWLFSRVWVGAPFSH